MQQQLAAAKGRLGIGNSLQQQLFANFLLGHRFALHEFLLFLNVLVAVEGNADAFPPVAAGPSGS
jgi:hypothetical protein